MAYTTKLAQFIGAPFLNLTLYHNIICSFQYLSFTQPNIFYTVSEVCQFMHSLTTVAPDIAAALKIIKSLERTDCWHPVL